MKNEVQKTTDNNANTVLYSVDSVNENICKQFLFDFGNLPIEKQKSFKKWIIDRLIEIEKETFDTKMWLNNPIRFWFNEYRHVLYCHFNGI
ncbi:MAG: hypothetical protein WCT77_00395 [Bacteroidota bacterium]